MIDRLIIENRLYQITDPSFADRVDSVVDEEDIGKLYALYERYVDHVKAQNRRNRR